MINRIAANMTGSYCLSVSQKITVVISHHLYYIMSSKYPSPSLTQERRRSDADANSTFNNRVTQSGPLAADASLQFVDVRYIGTIR